MVLPRRSQQPLNALLKRPLSLPDFAFTVLSSTHSPMNTSPNREVANF